ncbi:clarin-1 [Strongylocentrotus purpuratus]|uniref:Clarin-3 n=1 Tax=Strongylocentrotus purpuratus TaxID=7668 RepID=A0A7M7TG53_STRPU|nr:clarin-1 [Strongylocentrotus purpuratus]|eukprot:XP_781677.3 PREDICTED: clarin-1 [Strongylocentrotus purpuratus]
MCQAIIKRRATLFFMVTCGSIACMILLGIALGTTSWVRAYLVRDITVFNTSQPLRGFLGSNPIESDDPGAFNGVSFFGLFYGCKKFNYGLGGRKYNCYSVFSEHAEVYDTGMVIAVIIFLIPAAIFALISTIFGLVNILTVPIETLHGPVGLYIWNLIGVLCTAVSIILYLVIYITQIRFEVLNQADRAPPHNFNTSRVDFGFSFWLVVATFIILCVNIVLVFLAHMVENPNLLSSKKKSMNVSGKGGDIGLGIMY